MSMRFHVTKNRLLRLDDLNAITDQLVNGRLVVLPTETGYLLGADALNLDSVRRVFKVKNRPLTNPIHVIVSGLEMAEDLIFLSPTARRLCNSFMPGPLTIICPKKPIVSDLLVANTGNLGIRIPDNPVALQVAQAFRKPITATSLNVSGTSEGTSLDETLATLEWDDDPPIVVTADSALFTYPSASTVVTFAVEPWQILRTGPITEEEIAAATKSLNYTDVQDWT